MPLAYLYLLKNSYDFSINPLISSLQSIDPSLYEISDSIKDMICSLQTVLSENETVKYNYIQRFLKDKEQLTQKFRTLSGYITELNVFTFIIEELYQLKQLKSSDIGMLDYHQFYHECHDFVFKNTTDTEKNYRMTQILKNLPLRMTKDKFFDYVKQSIYQIEIDPSSESMNQLFAMVKQQFMGSTVEDYGTFFPDAATAIENFFSRDLSILSEEDLETVWEETGMLAETLSTLTEILSLLFEMMNDLSVLFMLENIDFDHLSNYHVAYKDLYFTTCSIIKNEVPQQEKELLIETLPDLLDHHIEIQQDKYKRLSDEIFKLVEKIDPSDEETVEIDKLLQTDHLIRMYMNMEISDSFNFHRRTDQEINNPEILDQYIKDLIDLMRNKLTDMPTLYRKARMQHLLGALPGVFDEHSFIDYVQTAIEFSSTEEIKALALSRIGNIMDTYGFFDHETEHHHH
jgi:mRNA-degrading endonuclease YafQ of YafQ-DinJ toxin-antitoxin module